MEKFDTRRSLGSYSVDHRLLRNLQDFINTGIPRIFDLDKGAGNFSNHSRLTLVGLKEGKLFKPMTSYTQTSFSNDIHVLRIELQYACEDGQGMTRAVVLILRLGSSHSDSELSIALQGENAKEKTRVIEEGLLEVLEPNKNMNRIVYPNEFMPTLVFIIGFFSGIGVLMFSLPILKALCIVLFGTAIYFVARRFTKGYCSFESPRQRKLDVFFRWFSFVLLLFVIAAVLISLFGTY